MTEIQVLHGSFTASIGQQRNEYKFGRGGGKGGRSLADIAQWIHLSYCTNASWYCTHHSSTWLFLPTPDWCKIQLVIFCRSNFGFVFADKSWPLCLDLCIEVAVLLSMFGFLGCTKTFTETQQEHNPIQLYSLVTFVHVLLLQMHSRLLWLAWGLVAGLVTDGKLLITRPAMVKLPSRVLPF